ncbi:Disease resistance protein (NBS class) family [Raphanus sativus]|nr:Disease resistance protein (NBS class) family [Raphanus sativus]
MTFYCREAAELIEKIAKNVFEKLNPTENIGTHKQLRVLENLLCKQPWGFRSIGILGKPGIGKTTFVEAAFRRMRDGYDVHFIIECNNKIIEHFSDEDFQEILVEKFDLNNQDAGPCHRRKRLLLVLDGLQNAQDAEYFLCGFNRFGPGSLLIITSSDRKVLEQCHVNEIYELKGLNDEDALKLFTRCVFGKDVIDEELRKLSVSEIERCEGNPSTIRSHAEKMKRKRMKTIDIESALSKHNVSMTLKQSFSTGAHKYQADLEKFLGFDLANTLEIRLSHDLRAHYLYHDSTQRFFFCTISSKYLSDFKDRSLLNLRSHAVESMPIDLKILHLGQKYKPWEEYKSFSIFKITKLSHSEKLVELEEIWEARDIERIDLQDRTSMESITVVTDQLEPLQLLHISSCLESQILQWGLQTDPLCLLYNSANETKSHFYFDCTFCRSIWIAISSRIHLSPLQICEDVFSAMVNLKESKAKELLSRMAWHSTIYALLFERSSRLYRRSYRSRDAILAQIDREFRNQVSRLRKRHPKVASKILGIWLGTSSSH